MAEERVSRREFLARTSIVASTAVAAAAPGEAGAQQPAEHAQSDYSVRARALVSVLTRKNLIDPAQLDAIIEFYETQVGPHAGARLVARSWIDPGFRERLLSDANAAATELGIERRRDLVAVANTPRVHNLVVCTLCSCYPWYILGLPPTWYKDSGYRARSVIDPRGVLREFGTDLGADVEVRVWDSTAEVRYLVIPERPPGTDGMTEAALEGIVTRDSMIGAEKLTPPA
ncbi:MAG: nitrile hydratase subunit alpha [Rhodospirillaceae bacterium]|nr:nitrile hydratase subunit alpha [Rhodospirillaceae bacterium]